MSPKNELGQLGGMRKSLRPGRQWFLVTGITLYIDTYAIYLQEFTLGLSAQQFDVRENWSMITGP